MIDRNKWSSFIVLLIVVIVPLIFFFFFFYKPHPTTVDNVLPIYGPKKLSVGGDTIFHTIPDFKFVAHTGVTIDQTVVKNMVYVTDFFFTECPGICVSMTENLKKVQSEFFDAKDFMILSHTVDPETDSVPKLYKHAQHHEINSKKWLLLTGEKVELYDMARFGYFVTAIMGDGGPDDFIHSERLILVDKESRIRGYYDGTDEKEVEKLIKDTKSLLVSYLVPPR